ncbi:MAG: hypothetical protein J6X55_07850, partial [Victivallales bacterium]|nr:hypothetical protein [Victivallales bacterium]
LTNQALKKQKMLLLLLLLGERCHKTITTSEVEPTLMENRAFFCCVLRKKSADLFKYLRIFSANLFANSSNDAILGGGRLKQLCWRQSK